MEAPVPPHDDSRRRAGLSMSVAESLDPLPYRAWLCDLDGTLYRQRPLRAAMAAELALGGWRVVRLLRHMRHELEAMRSDERYAQGDPFAEQVRRVAERLALPPQHVEQAVRQWMIRRPGKWLWWFRRQELLARIARFRAGGGRTAIVSDYPARDKLHSLGVSDLFDYVVASGEPDGPPRLKPWPDGYLLAAERLGLAPAECLVIGDRRDADGLAAQRAGMAFEWIG